jgi:hypothetical protein
MPHFLDTYFAICARVSRFSSRRNATLLLLTSLALPALSPVLSIASRPSLSRDPFSRAFLCAVAGGVNTLINLANLLNSAHALLRFMFIDYFDYWVGNVYCFSLRDAVDEVQALRLQPGETFNALQLVRIGPFYWWPSVKVA